MVYKDRASEQKPPHSPGPRPPSPSLTWLLALLIPILAAGGVWLVSDATIARSACLAGRGGEGILGSAAWVVLMLIGPATVAWRVRRATLGRDMFPVLMSVLLSLFLALIEPWLWWFDKTCWG